MFRKLNKIYITRSNKNNASHAYAGALLLEAMTPTNSPYQRYKAQKDVFEKSKSYTY